MNRAEHLTKNFVEAVRAPEKGQDFVRDDALKGFALRILPGGTKSFIWEGRVNGRVRRITIGEYPDLTVAAARDEVLRIRTAIADGRDPYSERLAEKRETTFGELSEEYMRRHALPRKRSAAWDQAKLRSHIPQGW